VKDSAADPVLLYCFPKRSTFIDRDVQALSSRCTVRQHELNTGPDLLLPVRLLQQLIWLLANKAWQRDAICHFSGYHAVFPALLARRCFIILAGSDCASIPAIGYGNHARKLMGWATRFAARKATRLLPVHASLMSRSSDYADIVPREQGISVFAPGLSTPWTEIPYGFDGQYWCPDETSIRSPERFVCVAGPAAPNNRVHVLKGIDLLLQIAERTPQARFQIVGLADPDAYGIAPPNVTFTGRVAPDQLRDMYRRAAFYVQLSLSEGMPNALCEAMLCGCIPLVSNVASMPSIIAEHGRVLRKRDAESGSLACLELLALSSADRALRSQGSRERILSEFPKDRRAKALFAVLASAG
jgi:glycosyltransferase involved in cell wall biosynthesis